MLAGNRNDRQGATPVMKPSLMTNWRSLATVSLLALTAGWLGCRSAELGQPAAEHDAAASQAAPSRPASVEQAGSPAYEPAPYLARREPVIVQTSDNQPIEGEPSMLNLFSQARPSNGVEHVGSADFESKVLRSDVPVLVGFYADWCGPCRALGPTLDQLARETPGAKVVKVNVDEASDLAAEYGVSAIPALMVFEGGRVTAQHVGMASKGELKALLAR